MAQVNMPGKKEGAMDTANKAFQIYQGVKGAVGGSGEGDSAMKRRQKLTEVQGTDNQNLNKTMNIG